MTPVLIGKGPLFWGGLPSKIRGHLGSRYRLGLVGFLCFCYRTALSNTVVGRSYLWLNWTGGKWSLKKVGHPQEDHMSGQFLAISQPRSPQNAVVYLRESYQKGPLVQVQFAQIFDLGAYVSFFSNENLFNHHLAVALSKAPEDEDRRDSAKSWTCGLYGDECFPESKGSLI